MPRVVEHAGAGAFLQRAGAWLGAREDHHNLILGFAEALASAGGGPPGVFAATVEVEDVVAGCVLRAPPHQAILTEMPPEAAPEVGRWLGERVERLPGVVGPRDAARGVASGWVARRGGGWREGMHQGLYRLDRVVPPSPVPGAMRRGTSDDVALGRRWGVAFADDTGIDFDVTEEVVTRWISSGALRCWEVDGAPASMAVAQGRTAHGVRIGFVYTPPELRGNGYASALVAELSQEMLDSGCSFCVLYTDLANPTSNAIYQRLGYRRIGEVLDLHLVEVGDE